MYRTDRWTDGPVIPLLGWPHNKSLSDKYIHRLAAELVCSKSAATAKFCLWPVCHRCCISKQSSCCHFRDRKARLVTSLTLTHVSSTVTSIRLYLYECLANVSCR